MRKIAILMGVLFFGTLSVFAQNQIKGKITDMDGIPIADVSVKIKGTTRGNKYEARW